MWYKDLIKGRWGQKNMPVERVAWGFEVRKGGIFEELKVWLKPGVEE